MKYIIDVPNQDYSYDEILHTLKLKFYDDNLSCEVLLDAESYTEPDRKAIEDEVWGFTKTFINMCVEDFHNAFNTISYKRLTGFSYQEAKAKYNEWIKRNRDGCNGCKHEDKMNYEEPCSRCKQNYKDKWEGEF